MLAGQAGLHPHRTLRKARPLKREDAHASGDLRDDTRRHAVSPMKNVTVSLDDEAYRTAERLATVSDMSVEGVVEDYLIKIGAPSPDLERIKREVQDLRGEMHAYQAAELLRGEALYSGRPA